jgi:phenylalanyl-tRNA synthetase beta chain
VVEGAVDAYPNPLRPSPVRLRVRRVHQVLGIEIPSQKVKDYLKDLELDVKEGEDENVWVVTPPSFRGDLEREIDLIEEIARLNGYDQIPLTLPKGPPSSEEGRRDSPLEKKAMEVLIQHGYFEVITYSFTSPSSWDLIGLVSEDPRRKHLQVLNPLSEDLSVLRTSLIPDLMETARYNVARKNSNLKIFELKRVFFPQEGEKLPREVKYLAGLAMGLDRDPHWAFSSRPIDFYDIKGCVEDLLEVLQIKEVKFNQTKDIPYLHPGKAASILCGKEVLGVLGEVHPQVLGHYEIEGKAYLFEIDFEQTVKWAREGKQFRPLPKFPSIYRDLSLVVDDDLEVEKVTEAIWNFHEPFIDEVNLFDVYRGDPIPSGKKGVSYRIRYQSNDRTLTDEEVNRYHETVIFRLREIFQAELRR